MINYLSKLENLLTWTASNALTISTIEAVVISFITNSIPATTFVISDTLSLTLVGVSVAVVIKLAVRIRVAATVMVILTNRCWVGAIAVTATT